MTESLQALAGEDSLVAWFLAEIADTPDWRPGGETPLRLGHALATLLVMDNGCSSQQDCAIRLEAALRAKENRTTLARARQERDQGRYDPYLLHLPESGGEQLQLRISPRPLLDSDGQSAGCLASLEDVTALRRDLHALGEVHEKFRLLFDILPIGITITDEKGRVLEANPTSRLILGVSPNEASPAHAAYESLEVLRPDGSIMSPEEYASTRALKSGAVCVANEMGIVQLDGDVRWVDVIAAPLPLPGYGLVLAYVDVTERRASEQAVEAERRRLFGLLDRLPAFVSLLSPRGEIRFTNKLFREDFASPEALRAYDAMHADKDGEPGPLRELFHIHSLNIWEWYCEASGKHYQVFGYPYEDIDGSPLALELGIDITASKKAQEALLASEERYRSIAESLALGLGIVDRDMRLSAVNPRLREWLPHIDFEAAPDFRGLFPSPAEEDTGDESECFVTLVREDGQVREALHEVQTPAGTRRMQVTYSPVFTPEGRIEAVIVLVDDVTEKLQVQARLQRAEKLEALGTLAGGIAHEINQPLNALQLYASGLEMLVEKDHEFDRETLLTRLGWILRETGRIHGIISHMRALVRQEAGPTKPSAANLEKCVNEALSLLQAQLKAHDIELLVETAPGLGMVQANSVQLEQVVINLVVNAMQALDGVTRPDKRILLRMDAKGRRISLRVEDNGPGLQEVADRVFDPFFSSKDAGMGMGLGLSIVHTFVNSWGGEIRAGNSEMGGASFTVLLRPSSSSDSL